MGENKIKRCPICGKEMVNQNSRARYCSIECRRIANFKSQTRYKERVKKGETAANKKIRKRCSICGKMFITTAFDNFEICSNCYNHQLKIDHGERTPSQWREAAEKAEQMGISYGTLMAPVSHVEIPERFKK